MRPRIRCELSNVEKRVFIIFADESGDRLVIIQFSAPSEARSVSQVKNALIQMVGKIAEEKTRRRSLPKLV